MKWFGRAEKPRVSIIVPVFAPDLLPACLNALSRHAPAKISFEVIVVLNGTTPAVERCLGETTLPLHVVRSSVNLGLAGAGNRGRSVARGELLVILHDDAEVESGWMEALVATVDEHPEAGAVGGKVLFPDGTLQDAGKIIWRDGRTLSPWVGPPPSADAFDRVRAVDYCGTSSLLIRAEIWNAIGGMNEAYYPVYYVDVDLCMAVRRLGRVVLYQPKSRIRHHRGAATGSRDYREFVTLRNRVPFLEKWGSALQDHEAEGETDEEPAQAIRRAMERAEAFARTCRQNWRPIPKTRRPRFDAAEQDRSHREKERQLKADYEEYRRQSAQAD